MTYSRKPMSATNRELVDRDRMKFHVRDVRVGARLFRVISPRPGLSIRVATNYFHNTWHIVCDGNGWRLMSRVFASLSIEKVPNTLFWIGPELMDPAPFDQEPSWPVIIVPSTVTHVGKDDIKQLVTKLSRYPHPGRTIRWSAPKVDPDVPIWDTEYLKKPRYVHTDLEGGAVTIRAEASALRELSRHICPDLGASIKTTHSYIDDAQGMRWVSHWQMDGEVQYYRHFGMMSRESAGLRKQILDQNPALKGDALVRKIHDSRIRWSLRYP